MSVISKMFIILFVIMASMWLFRDIPTPPFNQVNETMGLYQNTTLNIQTAAGQMSQNGDIFSTASFFVFIPQAMFNVITKSFFTLPSAGINLILTSGGDLAMFLITPILFLAFFAIVGWLFGRQQI